MVQKLFKTLGLRVTFLVVLLCSIFSGNTWATDVTYTVTSTSAVSKSGTAPDGASATYSSTYSSKFQLTANNSMTLTLSGYNGYNITGLTLSMKSNTKGGAGKLKYSTDNGSTWTYIVGSSSSAQAFNTSNWYGSWSTSYVDVSKTSLNIECGTSNVKFVIEATANSLYCQSFTLTYSPTTVAVSSVALNKASTSIIEGNTETLTATISPDNATNKAVTWTSSNTSVATVANGVVTAVAAGSATITVTTEDGSKTATCDVTVTSASAPNATLSETELAFGDVEAGSTKNMTFTVTPANLTEALSISSDNEKYTVSPTSIAADVTTAQTITVTAAPTSMEDDMDGTITISGGGLASDKTVTVSATPYEGASVSLVATDNKGTFKQGEDVVTSITSRIGGTATVTAVPVEGYEFLQWTATNATPSTSTNATEEFTFTSATATLTASFKKTDAYVKITDASTLSAGDKIIFVNETANMAMGGDKGNNRDEVNVSINNNRIASISANVQVFTLEGSSSGWYFNTGSGYIYAASSSDNYLKTQKSKNDNSKALISISGGDATITFQGTNTRNQLRYNSTSGLFSCYASGQSMVQIYRVEKTSPELSVSATEISLEYGETKSFTVSKSGDGELTVESNDPSVATVAENGEIAGQYNVTYVGDGSTTISVSTSETSTYASDSKSVTITAADGRTAAGLSYTNASESAVIAAGTSHTQTLNNPNTLDVTYTSSDETVATIDSDGEVTLKKAGTVTITASFAGNASYKPGNASYTLTITNKSVATLVFNEDEMEKLTTDAKFTNAWTTDPNAIGVLFCSSNTGVATIDSEGEVTIVGAGETTIAATINDEDYEATEFTYILTVSKADATISFSAATAEVALDETESFVAPTFSNAQSLTITWTSSDETVATVNSSGVISFLKAGETTITATSTENSIYKSGSVSYTLTVNKAAENMPFIAAFSSTLGDFTVTPDGTNTGVTWAINNSSAKASGFYSSSNHTGTAWLVSPYINISNAYATLSFQHAGSYFEADANMTDEATLWIREKGGDWEELTIATYPTGVNTSSKSSFVTTSNSLSSYSGKKVQIGFKYSGNSTKAGSWFIKNFRVADDREEAPISFADATVYKLLKDKDTYTGQVLTNEEDLTVSYSSSDEDVATVNSSTGVVTIKAVGETNITATYAETTSYKANTATYKLVVTSKAAAEIEYAEDAATKKITLGTYTHTLTNPNSLTVAYTSSDETVATVNSSTGEVTMLKVGETTITATFTEDEDYDGAVVSYTLTVIKDDPTLTFAKSEVTIGLADGTYQQVVSTTPAELPITYSSSNTSVATVAADGTVTLLKTGNTTISASFAGSASYNSANKSYSLDVVINYAELPFSYNKGYSDIGTSLTTGTTGLMQSGLSTSDYSTTNTKLKFDGTGDYVILKIAEVPGTLSFNIKGNSFSKSTFKVQTSVDGESYSDLASYTSLGDESTETFNLAGNVRYVKWIYTNKSAGNVGLGNISLTKTNTITLAEACTDGSKYYGTYSLGKAFVVPEGLTVSTVGIDNEGKLTVTDYSTGDVVKANTGVMVSATTAGAKTVTVSAETGTENDGNLLKASGDAGITAVNMAEDDTKFYRLTMHKGTDLGFWWGAAEGAAFALAANKAYLAVPNDAVAGVKDFMWFEDETTGIDSVENDKCQMSNAIFDLSGRRIQKPTKGLYIVNGKKYIKK